MRVCCVCVCVVCVCVCEGGSIDVGIVSYITTGCDSLCVLGGTVVGASCQSNKHVASLKKTKKTTTNSRHMDYQGGVMLAES